MKTETLARPEHLLTRRGTRLLAAIEAIKGLGLAPAVRANRIKRFSQETLTGFYVTRVTIALFNIGFIDELAERRAVNLETFAASRHLDLKVLKSLCDYLYALRILDRKGGSYTLNRQRPFVGETLNGPFYSVYAYQDIFHNLEALLKNEEKYGVDVCRQSEYVARGSGAVGKLMAFPMVTQVLNRNKFGRILDLCCGDATFLIDLCERDKNMVGFGLDISPEAIAFGREKVEQHHLTHRIHLSAGDAFNVDTEAAQLHGIDAATCIYALHEFLSDDNERILELFRRFRESLPGVPLVICEVMRHSPEELREKPGGVAEIQLWHELSDQRLLGRDEWKALFRQAGFRHVVEDYVGFARTAIFTVS